MLGAAELRQGEADLDRSKNLQPDRLEFDVNRKGERHTGDENQRRMLAGGEVATARLHGEIERD